MPKIDITSLPVTIGSRYPAPYNTEFEGRRQIKLGDPMGLTQFGVNLVALDPGAMSSLRHWHRKQDEFLVVTAGTLTLVDDDGETLLNVGDCAAFPADDRNGHHIVNKAETVGAFVVVGTRTPTEFGQYSDIDMQVHVENGVFTFSKADGTVLEQPE